MATPHTVALLTADDKHVLRFPGLPGISWARPVSEHCAPTQCLPLEPGGQQRSSKADPQRFPSSTALHLKVPCSVLDSAGNCGNVKRTEDTDLLWDEAGHRP